MAQEHIPVDFATEHIFELQEISDLFKSKDVKNFMDEETDAATAFKDRKVYTEAITPLGKLAKALSNQKKAFVYLETKVNGIKAVYFGRHKPALLNRNPGSERQKPAVSKRNKPAAKQPDLSKIAEKIIYSILVVEYLTQPKIEAVYKDISTTLRTTWEGIGTFLAGITKYEAVGNGLKWADAYDAWEEEFIDTVQENIQDAIRYGMEQLDDANSKGKYPTGMTRDGYKAFHKKVPRNVDLSGLKRHLKGKEVPDQDPASAKHTEELRKKLQNLKT